MNGRLFVRLASGLGGALDDGTVHVRGRRAEDRSTLLVSPHLRQVTLRPRATGLE
ncbi:hypothetical protein GCM10027519_32990 [Kineococcus endophyticus]